MIFRGQLPSHSGMLSLLLLTIISLTAGCGQKGEHETAKVQGKVTLDGQPLKFGSLLFTPEGNFPSAEGTIRPDGTYSLGTYGTNDGAVIAKHKVIITARAAGAFALPEDSVKGAAGTVSVVPERYGNAEKSGLVADVESGTNTVNFDLVSTEAKPAK